jgi:transposase
MKTPTILVPEPPTLFFAIELGGSNWRLTFRDGRSDTIRRRCIDAGSLAGLAKELDLAKAKLGLPATARVLGCYEAGRDGFWIHRALAAREIEVLVLDPASLQIDRRFRRPKNDRLDGEALVAALIRWSRGDTQACRVVQVPTSEQEDARRDSRERDRLRDEEARHRSRMSALLALHGVVCSSGLDSANLATLHTPDDSLLPSRLLTELEREQQRLQLVCSQRDDLERVRQQTLKQALKDPTVVAKNPLLGQVIALMQLVGIGPVSSWQLAQEFFFRKFNNRREVGNAAGMVNAPFDSGNSERDQGITKAGNGRVRSLMVELAWMWLRFQPHSALSKWFQERFAYGKRTRRVGIVALARRLLIALWRYVEKGTVPTGAMLRIGSGARGGAGAALAK